MLHVQVQRILRFLFFPGDDVEFTELDVPEAVSAFSDESDADSFNYKQFSLIETSAYCVVEAESGSCHGSYALLVTLKGLWENFVRQQINLNKM